MLIRQSLVLFAVVGLFAAGCAGKLDVSNSYQLEPMNAKGFECPAQSVAQKFNIEFSSSDSDVTVSLFKSSDIKEGDIGDVDASKALGKQTGKSGSFSVDVPEKTATYVIVRDAKKSTKVDVKVSNRK
jgi:hypothetical protein